MSNGLLGGGGRRKDPLSDFSVMLVDLQPPVGDLNLSIPAGGGGPEVVGVDGVVTAVRLNAMANNLVDCHLKENYGR